MAKRNVKTLGAALSRTNRPLPEDVPARDAADGLGDMVAGLRQMSLKNEKTGVGTYRDQRSYSDYYPTAPINRATLENCFRSSWLAQRIICTLPEEMLRPWRTMKWGGMDEGDDDIKVVKRYEKKVKLKKRLLTASKWARLYGGAIIVPVLRSQPDEVLEEPLDYDQIEKDDLIALHVFDRWRASHDGSVVIDAFSPQNGMPEHYRLAESSVRLHWSRVIRLDGKEIPYFQWRANSMWNDSVLQPLFNDMKGYDTAVAALTTMLFQINIDVVTMGGLRNTLSQKGGEAKIIERFRQFAMGKSFNGTAVLDKDSESYERHAYTFSGIADAFEQVMFNICGAADTPFTKLFGQSPAGLNATGESDDQNWVNHLTARREEHIDDALTQLDEFLIRSALGSMPDDYESDWNPVDQPTSLEVAQEEQARASTAKAHWDMGAIDEGVVAGDLYSRGVYSGMTKEHVENAKRTAKQALQDPNRDAMLQNPKALTSKKVKGNRGLDVSEPDEPEGNPEQEVK